MSQNCQLSIVIPTYRESLEVVRQTIEELIEVLTPSEWSYEIIIVNDGSGREYSYVELAQIEQVHLVEHAINKGYGAAIKTGIRASEGQWIGITDADGTYPNRDFPRLLEQAKNADMVVGIRRLRDTPWMRRIPKFLLNRYASFLINEGIDDLNSGMRIFKKELVMKFWHLYPEGFSLTSTLTMASLAYGYTIQNVPIAYFPRQGQSSIRPIADTYRFFKIVGRLGLYFNPLRIFGPVAGACLVIGGLKGVRDYLVVSHLGNLSISFLLAGLQIYLMGLLAALISKTILTSHVRE